MWWNILPSAAIIWVAFNVPDLVEKPVSYMLYGKGCYRRCVTNKEAWHYLRDMRLGDGNVYNTKGLENIPDAES